jgi:hypothetical protein
MEDTHPGAQPHLNWESEPAAGHLYLRNQIHYFVPCILIALVMIAEDGSMAVIMKITSGIGISRPGKDSALWTDLKLVNCSQERSKELQTIINCLQKQTF